MQPHAMDGLREALERWPSPVEGDGLENRYGSLAHREFKSPPLRHIVRLGGMAFGGSLQRGCHSRQEARNRAMKFSGQVRGRFIDHAPQESDALNEVVAV